MDQNRLSFLFHHYVNNSCTEQEREELLALIEKPENEEKLKVLLDQYWQVTVDAAPADEQIFNRILTQSSPNKSPKKHQRSALRVLSVCIAITAVAGSVIFFYPSNRERPVKPGAAFVDRVSNTHERLQLSDGSTVILNKGSKLIYPQYFEGAQREVSLEGEAFFDIAHDPSRPFIVKTGALKTTVLGTAFNVRAFPDDKNIIVTVTRGKVKVSDDKKVLGILTRDQQITFNIPQAESVRADVNSKEIVSWFEKDIFFDDVTLEMASKELESRFGVAISFDNEQVKDCRFTATFIQSEDLEQILNVICQFNQATYTVDSAGKVRIDGPGCQ